MCDQGLMGHVHSPLGMPKIMSTTKMKEGRKEGTGRKEGVVILPEQPLCICVCVVVVGLGGGSGVERVEVEVLLMEKEE